MYSPDMNDPVYAKISGGGRPTILAASGFMLLAAVGYLAFLLLIGHIPIYYLAMLLFTWGEIFSTISSGPYVTRRVPASHRGRINAVTSVLGAVVHSGCALAVGRLYDNVGRTSSWALVLALLAAAAVMTLLLIRLDRVKFPKLYETTQEEIQDVV